MIKHEFGNSAFAELSHILISGSVSSVIGADSQ